MIEWLRNMLTLTPRFIFYFDINYHYWIFWQLCIANRNLPQTFILIYNVILSQSAELISATSCTKNVIKKALLYPKNVIKMSLISATSCRICFQFKLGKRQFSGWWLTSNNFHLLKSKHADSQHHPWFLENFVICKICNLKICNLWFREICFQFKLGKRQFSGWWLTSNNFHLLESKHADSQHHPWFLGRPRHDQKSHIHQRSEPSVALSSNCRRYFDSPV